VTLVGDPILALTRRFAMVLTHVERRTMMSARMTLSLLHKTTNADE
jgi:hypothetical protein